MDGPESQEWPDPTTGGLAQARHLLRRRMRQQSHEFVRIFNGLLADIAALDSRVDAKSA